MTQPNDTTSQRDQQAQREYADQPTYREQSEEAAPEQAGAQHSQDYREQDYGGESTYDPDKQEQSRTAGEQR
jgi:hypothetical protein